MAGPTMLSSLLSLSAFNASAEYHNPGDYKALVCVLLAGGNDSYNMLVPVGEPEYNEYQSVRSGLALPRNQILTLLNGFNNGRELGIHPALTNVREMYDNGSVAFLANVGSLVESVTKEEFNQGTKQVPLGLFSHTDQIAHWQTSIPQERGNIGWGGRMAELLATCNTNPNISMNISLSGSSKFQTGESVRPFTLTSDGTICINGYGAQGLFNEVKTSAIDSLFGQEYQNLFEFTYGNILKNSIAANQDYVNAVSNLTPLQTTFTMGNPVAAKLKIVAESIAAREALGMSRQIFFVQLGGWDHHGEVLNNQQLLLNIIDRALSDFKNALSELGVFNDVTTFTISDFGRTLTSNGNGSDHAWGGNAMMMGGAVNGGSIYGLYPDLFIDNPLDLGRGRLIPTTSADAYFAELALWFGVPTSELDLVLPNIHNFYDVLSPDPPIGFLLS